ncbi:hypothetical protein AB0L06_31045 [Spirillospora sp. NPDC052269]
MTNRHPFIAIEGLDGTGKTTLRKGLFRLWQGLFDVAPLCLLTTNFLSPEHAEQIVEGKYRPSADNRAAHLAAIVEDKNQTLQRLVRPQRGVRPVIADRWLLSDLAFFAVKHGARAQDTYRTLAEGLVDGPDATLLLELAPTDSMRRAKSRTGEAVREDWDVHDVQSRLHDAHEAVVGSSGSFPLLGTMVRLDATLTPAEVLHSAWTSLERLGLIPSLSADLERES